MSPLKTQTPSTMRFSPKSSRYRVCRDRYQPQRCATLNQKGNCPHKWGNLVVYIIFSFPHRIHLQPRLSSQDHQFPLIPHHQLIIERAHLYAMITSVVAGVFPALALVVSVFKLGEHGMCSNRVQTFKRPLSPNPSAMSTSGFTLQPLDNTLGAASVGGVAASM